MAIKADNNRNEPRPPVGSGNRLPEQDDIDVRTFGHAGARVLLDRTLRAVDGFGAAQFEAAGIDVREIVEERERVNDLLVRVVRYDGRRASRRRHRSAALRLLGHLKAAEAVDVMAEVVRSREEPVTVRAAALDALGMLGDETAVELVAAFVDNDDERIATRALWALGRLGRPEHLSELERRLERSEAGQRNESMLDALGAIGVRHGIPVAIPERDRKRPRPRRTSEVDPAA